MASSRAQPGMRRASSNGAGRLGGDRQRDGSVPGVARLLGQDDGAAGERGSVAVPAMKRLTKMSSSVRA